jgi:transposase InsO family protein
MIFRLVRELAGDGIDVAVACRVLGVPRSSFYDWLGRPASSRDRADADLIEEIREIHTASRQTYGAPRVHDELRLGRGRRVGRKRIARLMRQIGLVGVCHQRKRPGRSAVAVHDDLVQRRFRADRPDRLWFTDITEHPTREGKLYCCCVLDCYSRRVVGWAIADHVRAELVVDALQMAKWNRSPKPGTIVHSDRGGQYVSWIFGHRLREAGLLGSMGRVASSVDNSLIESFWSTMQRELLDRHAWQTRNQLATAIFEWIEAFYNPVRRHTSIGSLSPADYEARHTPAAEAA